MKKIEANVYRVTDADGAILVVARSLGDAMKGWREYIRRKSIITDPETYEPESIEKLGADAVLSMTANLWTARG